MWMLGNSWHANQGVYVNSLLNLSNVLWWTCELLSICHQQDRCLMGAHTLCYFHGPLQEPDLCSVFCHLNHPGIMLSLISYSLSIDFGNYNHTPSVCSGHISASVYFFDHVSDVKIRPVWSVFKHPLHSQQIFHTWMHLNHSYVVQSAYTGCIHNLLESGDYQHFQPCQSNFKS